MTTTNSEKLRSVMTTSLEDTEGLEGLDEDPQLTTDVVSNPEDTDLQLRLLEVRDRLQGVVQAEMFDFITDLNIDVDQEAVKKRLSAARLVMGEQSSPYFRENYQPYPAWYSPKQRTLFVTLEKNEELANFVQDYDEAEVKPIDPATYYPIVHEYFHASSSHLFVTRGESVERIVPGLDRHPEFRWLDEAITEDLTLTLLDRITDRENLSQNVEGAYQKDRDLLDEIVRVSGIPKEVFYEAYFEEPDLKARPGQRMPKWHALQQALHAKFGSNFLQRVAELKHEKPELFWSYDDFLDNPDYKYGHRAVEYLSSEAPEPTRRLATRGLSRVLKRHQVDEKHKRTEFWRFT